MNTPFFFFGSLRDPLILEAVLGRALSHVTFAPAWMPDCRIERAAGYSFPLLIPSSNHQAIGTLAYGLSSADQARIAYFEDSEYLLKLSNVRAAEETTQAWVYVASEKLASSGEAWDLGQFQKEDRDLLLAVTRFVMTEHYGVTPQSTMEQIWGSIRDRIAREMGLSFQA
jgi:hypothetical protein